MPATGRHRADHPATHADHRVTATTNTQIHVCIESDGIIVIFSAWQQVGRTLRPNRGCLVCRGVDVEVGFPGSTYLWKRGEEVRAMLTIHLFSGLTREEVDLIVAEELHLLDAAA